MIDELTDGLILVDQLTTTKTTYHYKFPKKDSLILVETEHCSNNKCTYEYRLEFDPSYVFPENNKYIIDEKKYFSRLQPALSVDGKFRDYVKSVDYAISNDARFEFHDTKVTSGATKICNKSSIVTECSLKSLKDQSIFDKCELFFISHSYHMIYDEQGRPVSRVMYCDYINSVFNNSELTSLKKVINHIKDHPWVINPNDLEIRDVPYYNNENGDRRYIENLYLCPSDEEWMELIEKQVKENKGYGKSAKDHVYHRVWKEYDPLGISQFIRPQYPNYED